MCNMVDLLRFSSYNMAFKPQIKDKRKKGKNQFLLIQWFALILNIRLFPEISLFKILSPEFYPETHIKVKQKQHTKNVMN